ncbi:MAG: hypothetical protein WDN45_15885 [Caulobacteraceae bacterium]
MRPLPGRTPRRRPATTPPRRRWWPPRGPTSARLSETYGFTRNHRAVRRGGDRTQRPAGPAGQHRRRRRAPVHRGRRPQAARPMSRRPRPTSPRSRWARWCS